MPRQDIILIQTEERGIVRELDSKALLSTDRDALQRNRTARSSALENRRLRTEVQQLHNICKTFEEKLEQLTSLVEKLT